MFKKIVGLLLAAVALCCCFDNGEMAIFIFDKSMQKLESSFLEDIQESNQANDAFWAEYIQSAHFDSAPPVEFSQSVTLH